jgi:lysozyme
MTGPSGSNYARLIALVKGHEGFRQTVYLCPSGKRTIGYGRNIDDRPLQPEELQTLAEMGCPNPAEEISQRCADYLLRADVIRTWHECWISIPPFRRLDGARRAALVDMAYNMGTRTLLRFVGMMACLVKRDYEGAAAEALDSSYARQLPRRAARIARMIRTGRWPRDIETAFGEEGEEGNEQIEVEEIHSGGGNGGPDDTE